METINNHCASVEPREPERRVTSGRHGLGLSLVLAMVGTSAATVEGPLQYRTRGAVTARPTCGYIDEPVNLLPQSERFPGGAWQAAGSTKDLVPTIEADAEHGPSGSRNAARVTFGTGADPVPAGWSCLEAVVGVLVGETYTFSFSVRGPQGSYISARGAAGRGFSRIPLNGQWQRVHLTEEAIAANATLRIGLAAIDTGEAPLQERVSVLLWGPQLVAGRGVTTYHPSGDEIRPTWPLRLVAPNELRTECPPRDSALSSATNLLRWSTRLQRMPWVHEGLVGGHGGQGPTPIGTHDGCLLQESASAGPHRMSQEFHCPGAGTFVASIFARAGRRTRCAFRLELPGSSNEARFDLSTRTIGDGSETAHAELIGRGWVRIHLAGRASASGQAEMSISLLDAGDGDAEYRGDGSSGLIVWGPQVEAGTAATSFIPTFFIPEKREADEPVTAPSP
jgi:hypothetical protein